MKKRQLELFSDILSSGGYECEMYSSTFDFIKDRSAVTEEEFLKIPFSSKADVRKHDLESRINRLSPTFGIFGSSGTTGKKTYYKFSMNDRHVFDRIASRIMHRVGAGEGDLGIICAPVLDGVMAHTMMWEYTAVGAGYMNCPIPSPENFISVLNAAHPTVVSGLPSTLDFSLSPDFTVPEDSSIRLLLSGGNFFSNSKRRALEQKWGLDWYDFLGVSEIFGPIMGECREKRGLHYDSELFIVEIIDPVTLQPVEEAGVMGMLVITPLWNKGSPLVRYWTDDFAYRITEKCPCGEEGDRIYVCGRKNDYLRLGDRYIFPRDLEEIVFAHSGDCRSYVDIEDDGEITVYSRGLSNEGRAAMTGLFDRPLRFNSDYDFDAVRAHKPSLFSDRIKAHFNGD